MQRGASNVSNGSKGRVEAGVANRSQSFDQSALGLRKKVYKGLRELAEAGGRISAERKFPVLSDLQAPYSKKDRYIYHGDLSRKGYKRNLAGIPFIK